MDPHALPKSCSTLSTYVPKIRNTAARPYVTTQSPFQGSNLYGRVFTTHPKGYAVFSYGEHFPLYVALNNDTGTRWFGNNDRCSATTTRHMTLCRPLTTTITYLPTETLLKIIQEKSAP